MKMVTTAAELRSVLAGLAKGSTIGFVPTMGALHEGHLALVRQSLQQCDTTVVSIFVNPTQFGPNEDFDRYPRVLEADLALLKTEKVDVVFTPSVASLYPKGIANATRIEVPKLSKKLCGKTRKHFFRGVAMVVMRLLSIVRPTQLFLGEKDFQQCRVLQTLVNDLFLPVSVEIVPIVREQDGLAMSSRNRYLSQVERETAAQIYATLVWMAQEVLSGNLAAGPITTAGKMRLSSAGVVVDYLAIVSDKTLNPCAHPTAESRIVFAGYVGKTRLIDNLKVAHVSR
ncbi:MAG: pantoate--beta-alanine ligase [Candidatus Margulisiibacteriota bacterium]